MSPVICAYSKILIRYKFKSRFDVNAFTSDNCQNRMPSTSKLFCLAYIIN